MERDCVVLGCRLAASRALSWNLVLAITLMTLAGCGGGSSNSPTPPSASLVYPSGTQSLVVGTVVAGIMPTITGTLDNFTVSPALPAGMTMDTRGTIYGTPAAVTPVTSYTVTAMVAGGTSTSGTISLVVNDAPPSQLSYGSPSYTFSTTVASSTVSPRISGGAAMSWSINPALPAGLNFNTADGSISGTPSAPSASSAYVITAQNPSGKATTTVTIEVDAPLLNLGHQGQIQSVSANSTNVFSLDSVGNWILWDYTKATQIASGMTRCFDRVGICLSPVSDMAGSTAAVVTTTGLEVHATSDGHTLATITMDANTTRWWKLATDGSYIAAGSQSGLSAWSPSGQLLFSHPGNYSNAMAFAAPGEILVGAGPAGQSVVETVAVPSGTSTTGPSFNGQFASWFTDGNRFMTMAGSTALIYSSAGVQQGSITSAPTTLVGVGNWLWTSAAGASSVSIYPAAGTSSAPAVTYTVSGPAQVYAAGTTVALLGEYSSTAFSVIDLSGSAPAKNDYTSPLALSAPGAPPTEGPFAAVSASQWIVGTNSGVVVAAASLPGTTKYFGQGAVVSVAGGTGHFAIATAAGNILYFNSATLAQEGIIPFAASKLAASGDGSVLAALSSCSPTCLLNVYSLPSGTLQYTPGGAQDFVLSASGTVLGEVSNSGTTFLQEVIPTSGGATIFSSSFVSYNDAQPPPVRLSPDGTLIAASQEDSPLDQSGGQLSSPGTTLLLNGKLVTAFSGLPVAWLDNIRLLVNNYMIPASGSPTYSGCALYGPDGTATGGACALATEVLRCQPVASDTIYVPAVNQILSVSTGAVTWKSGDPYNGLVYPPAYTLGAIAGSRVIFPSGINVLAQTY